MTAWVKEGGVYRPGGQRSNVYVLCVERKENKHFRPGIRPGGSVTGVTEKLLMCQILDGRNHATVLAESLARVIAAIQIASVRQVISPLKTQKLVLTDPAFVVLRFESRNWRSLV